MRSVIDTGNLKFFRGIQKRGNPEREHVDINFKEEDESGSLSGNVGAVHPQFVNLVESAPLLYKALENCLMSLEWLQNTGRLPKGYMQKIEQGCSVLDEARIALAKAR